MMKKAALIMVAFLLLFMLQVSFRLGAQKINPLLITERFNEYVRNSPREEIYLHVDRYNYVAGEDVWFSIYCFDRAADSLSDKSTMAYVELLNPWNLPVIQSRFRLTGGRGEGNLLLPDSLSSGKYTIRAYTNWMKNFLPYNCFTQDVEICNYAKGTDFYDKISVRPGENQILFFPEGGKLVNGTSNKVVVRSGITSKNADNLQGVIFNSNRDSVTSFRLDESGFGIFCLTPENGKQYFALTGGESFSLPEAGNDNIAIKVNSVSDSHLEIELNISPLNSNHSDKNFFIVIRNFGKIMTVKEISSSVIVNKITIPVAGFKPGVSQIVLLNDEAEVLSERLFWLPEKRDFNLVAVFDSVYGSREKVELKTGINSNGYNSRFSDLSISVAPAMFCGNLKGISDYMIFASEFGDLPWEKGSTGDLDPAEVDKFLISTQSNWINWRDVFSQAHTPARYKFEKNGHYLTLSVRYRDRNVADSAKFIYMSVQGKVAEFDYATRDNEGRYTFTLPVDARMRNLILQPGNASNNMVLEIERPYPLIFGKTKTYRETLSGSRLEIFSAAVFNYQIAKIYKTAFKKEVQDFSGIDTKRRRFYGIPEMEVLLDDYISLPDMQEVFFELVPGVIIRTGRSGYEMKITNPLTGEFYEEPPLVMIDGVILSDLSVLVDLNPEVVEKIEVVKTPYLTGNLILHGIVNIITRSGDFSSVTLPDFAVLLPYRPVENHFSFIQPEYGNEEISKNRKPDLRNTLFWCPSLTTSGKAKDAAEFWTSDLPGDYVINIQGITESGERISFAGYFKIK